MMSHPDDSVTPMWNPWSAAGRLPYLDIVWADLGDHRRGHVGGTVITINSRLLQRERRVTLTHELEHLVRGVACHPAFRLREEEAVERTAARRLITLDQLVDALLWWAGVPHDDVADDLWVDLDCLEARLRALTFDERAHIAARFAAIETAA